MRHTTISAELENALGEYVHAAARLLQADIVAGAEVELELGSRRGRAHTAFYSCRPLTGEFIAAREPELRGLPEHETALVALAGFDGLDRYLSGRQTAAGELRAWDLRSRPGPVSGSSRRGSERRVPAGETTAARGQARAALSALLEEVFAEQTEFEPCAERLSAALARLERAELTSTPGTITLLASLHGMTIASPEIKLTRGLTIAKPATLRWAPPQALANDNDDGNAEGIDSAGHLLVALTCEEAVDDRAVLRELLRALRLFGDGRVTLGSLGWARVDGQDAWSTVSLGTGGRPYGMLVVSAEQEDELRAFCNLISRRAPDGNELAWALRRFELGCERANAYEGLSDHLLALRALLEPEGPASGLLGGRIAALCATPERRVRMTERMARAQRLERAVIAGSATESATSLAVAREVSDHLRALLRDVICGHLPVELAPFADQLLAEGAGAEADRANADRADADRADAERDHGGGDGDDRDRHGEESANPEGNGPLRAGGKRYRKRKQDRDGQISAEELLGDAGKTGEIAHVLV
jgi:hypothetical protein